MKTKTTLLLASAVALGFTITNARAADIAASPRLQQQLNERKAIRASDAATSPRMQHPISERKSMAGTVTIAASPRLQQQLDERKTVASSDTPNLVSGNYPGVAAKNPYFRPAPIEIAPLKGKSK